MWQAGPAPQAPSQAIALLKHTSFSQLPFLHAVVQAPLQAFKLQPAASQAAAACLTLNLALKTRFSPSQAHALPQTHAETHPHFSPQVQSAATFAVAQAHALPHLQLVVQSHFSPQLQAATAAEHVWILEHAAWQPVFLQVELNSQSEAFWQVEPVWQVNDCVHGEHVVTPFALSHLPVQAAPVANSKHSNRGKSEGENGASAVSKTVSTGLGTGMWRGLESACANTTYSKPTPNTPATVGQKRASLI